MLTFKDILKFSLEILGLCTRLNCASVKCKVKKE